MMTEHQRRMALYEQGLKDREISDIVGVTREAIFRWRRANNLPFHRKEQKTIKPPPDAYIFKRMLRQMFMPTSDSAIGIPEVVVRTRIRYVDRAI